MARRVSAVKEGGESLEEFDFVERPSQDFFCPVSLELLLDPQLTSCCGHHLSLDVANRLGKEGKPCPMCKGQHWEAVLDKYHRRKVNEVRVHCWYKDRGCGWVGEVKYIKGHADSCRRKRWMCKYCGLRCTYEEGGRKHWPICPKFPESCRNGCEVGSVERCGMEEHLKVCPLEPLACEMKEFGCEVVVPRKDMADHMRGSGIQHMITMTALNLRLTKQLKQKSDELRTAMKGEIKEMCHTLSSKVEEKIASAQRVTEDLIYEVKETVEQLETELLIKIETQQGLMYHMQSKYFDDDDYLDFPDQEKQSTVSTAAQPTLNSTKSTGSAHSTQSTTRTESSGIAQTGRITSLWLAPADGISADHNRCSGTEYFTFDKYSQLKGTGSDRLSPIFYTHSKGYTLKLGIIFYSAPHDDIGAELYMIEGKYDRELSWPVKIHIRLEIRNQLRDNRHVVKAKTLRWDRSGEKKSIDLNMIKYSTLERRLPNVQFMVNDCLNFKIDVSIVPSVWY